ncbi:MAG: hypothetical protein ACE15C_20200 [Phycisphaerae bacterium]
MRKSPYKLACSFLVALAGGVMALAGCAQPAPGPITFDTHGVAPALDYSPLAAVLAGAVTRDGLVNPSSLKDSQEALDRQLELLAVTGPTRTPGLLTNPDDRLAYWFNARAAWAMKLVLLAGCPRSVDRPEILPDRQFILDGRLMTLRQIDSVLAGDSDWRTLVVAPCVCLERAALPAAPFYGWNIRQVITQRFNDLIADQRRFTIDIGRQQVVVPTPLWDIRHRLIRDYETTYCSRDATLLTALLPYLEGTALLRVRDAAGYACVPHQAPPWHIALTKHDW